MKLSSDEILKQVNLSFKISTKNMSPEKIYFTIHPGDAGFTDQLLQFSAFYKLGLSLGYHYFHTPFYSRRSQAVRFPFWYSLMQKIPPRLPEKLNKTLSILDRDLFFNVHDFLGINQYLKSRKSAKAMNYKSILKVGLSDELIVKNGIESFKRLQDYITNIVSMNSGQKSEVTLINFRLTGRRKKLFSLINSNTPHIQNLIDFRAAYLEVCSTKNSDLRFKNDDLKILLHIRQGDTSIIETPWKTWIPIDSRRSDYLKQYNSLSELAAENNFQPSDYNVFLRGLISFLEKTSYFVNCFSDGYKLGLKTLIENADKAGIDSMQVRSLRKYQKPYEQKVFRDFFELTNTRCNIGETSHKLRDLINSALNSDILITSSQQRMIPKLVSLYCQRETPVVIVLYRENTPDYSDITIDHDKRFMYVDINNPDYTHILELLSELKKNSPKRFRDR